MKKLVILLGWIILFVIILDYHSLASADVKKTDYGFRPGVFHDGHEGTIWYRLLSPSSISNGRKYPLVIFLHGSWENGSDNLKQLIYVGPAFSNPEIRRKYPAFILAPQCPKGENWVKTEFYSGTRPMSPKPTLPAKLTLTLLDHLLKIYPIDPKRVYLMGVSSGGSGTWDLIIRSPERFAAAAPFSGGGDVTQVSRIKKLPVWAFHSKLDLVVNVSCTRNMVHALERMGGHPRYTEFDSPRHDCWTWTFKNSDFFRWLFEQRQR